MYISSLANKIVVVVYLDLRNSTFNDA